MPSNVAFFLKKKKTNKQYYVPDGFTVPSGSLPVEAWDHNLPSPGVNVPVAHVWRAYGISFSLSAQKEKKKKKRKKRG